MRRLIVLMSLLLLAGCTTTEPGTPTAEDQPPAETTTTTETTTSTTTSTANRPRNIDMAAVNICQVVGALPRAAFGLDTDRPPVGGESGVFPGSQDCFANGIQNNLGLTLIAVVSEGAAEYSDGANAEVDEVDANGFRLFVLTPASPDSCFGALDVNEGQMLFINYGLGAPSGEPVTPQVTLCQRIPDIARATLTLL